MKTPEEIKKVLAECDEGYACKRISCPYDDGRSIYNGSRCMLDARKDALAYIRQLERERNALLEDLRDADRIDCEHCASYDGAATKECEDADYLCDKCTRTDCPCSTCRDCSNWEWRGIQNDLTAMKGE